MAAKSLKHAFVSAIADDADTSLVRPSNWNAEHNLWLGARTVTGTSDTVLDADHLALVQYNSASAVAVTLPQAGASSQFLSGWTSYIRNRGAGVVTITPTTSTINEAATLVLNQNDYALIFSDGTNYAAILSYMNGAPHAPLASPTFTGDPKAPTPATGDNDTSIATTAFVKAQGYLSGNQTVTLSGDISGSGTTAITTTLPTVNANVGTFQGITVNAKGQVTAAANQSYAPLASPALSGNPTAPTPTAGDNDTSIATTAFVQTTLGSYQPLDADLTAIAALTGTNVIYYRSAADTWAAVTIGVGLSFSAGTLTNTGGAGGAAEYTFNTTTTAPPVSGQIRLNNATASAATIVWVHNTTAPGVDIRRILEGLPVGAKLIIQDKDDSSIYADYQIASVPVDNTTYWQFGVTYLAGAGTLTNNMRLLFSWQAGAAYQPLDGDLTSLAAASATGAIYYRSAADTWATVTIGSGLSFSAGTLDAPLFTSSAKGEVPASGGGTANFLRADATWAAPPGGGGGSATISVPQGRLTLQTGVPVMTTTQSAKTTLYYAPYNGGLVPIYDGTNFSMTAFTQLSVATTDTSKNPAAIGASKVNDWFVWNDAGTMRLSHGPDWTSDTARSAGTALVMVNGINLNNASITNGPAASRGTYVGTTRSNGSSQLDYIFGAAGAGGVAGFIGVWNAYNRVDVRMAVWDNTVSWTVGGSGAVLRQADNSAGNRVSFVSGLAEDAFEAQYSSSCTNSATQYGAIGIAYDSTTVLATNTSRAFGGGVLSATFSIGPARFGTVDLGFHYVQAMEQTFDTNNIVFYGNNLYLMTMLTFMWRC